jgi:hypothetical protein
MSLLLAGAVVGTCVTALILVLIVVAIGIHRQEHADSLSHRPLSPSAAMARCVLGLHTPGPHDQTDQSDDDTPTAKETTR